MKDEISTYHNSEELQYHSLCGVKQGIPVFGFLLFYFESISLFPLKKNCAKISLILGTQADLYG